MKKDGDGASSLPVLDLSSKMLNMAESTLVDRQCHNSQLAIQLHQGLDDENSNRLTTSISLSRE